MKSFQHSQHSLSSSTIKKDKYKLNAKKHQEYRQIRRSKEYWHYREKKGNLMNRDKHKKTITEEDQTNRDQINK